MHKPPIVTYSKRKQNATVAPVLPVDPLKRKIFVFEEPDSETNFAKSTHELNEAGENSRFVDEIEFLLDGLDDSNSFSIRKANLVEFLEKSESAQFCTRLRAMGYTPKIVAILLKETKNQEIVSMLLLLVNKIFRNESVINLGRLSQPFYEFLAQRLLQSRDSSVLKLDSKEEKTLQIMLKCPFSESENLKSLVPGLLQFYFNSLQREEKNLDSVIVSLLASLIDVFKENAVLKFSKDQMNLLMDRLYNDHSSDSLFLKMLVNITGKPDRVVDLVSHEVNLYKLINFSLISVSDPNCHDKSLLHLGILINICVYSDAFKKMLKSAECFQVVESLARIFSRFHDSNVR